MKNTLKIFGVVAIGLFAACSSNQQSTTTTDTTAVGQIDTASSTNPIFEDDKLKAIFSSYLSLKDKLVLSNLEESKTAATDLATYLKSQTGFESVYKITEEIAGSNDLASLRKKFTDLNVALIPVFKQASLKSGSIYLQHCPMANEGDGGDWLSAEKKIQNPYYGDEMLECGRVVEELKAK